MKETKVTGSSLTDQERRVLDSLLVAWNEFIKLPIEHPDQRDEFRHTFHDLQRQILQRPVRREEGWVL